MTPLFLFFLLPRNTSQNFVYNMPNTTSTINSSNKFSLFFEIKTSSEARLCIRQALGQLMEYAFFPNVKHADLLVVVGPGIKTENIESYIEKLNKDFQIHIDYLQIPL